MKGFVRWTGSKGETIVRARFPCQLASHMPADLQLPFSLVVMRGGGNGRARSARLAGESRLIERPWSVVADRTCRKMQRISFRAAIATFSRHSPPLLAG